MTIALVLFAAAAIGGIVLAALRIRGKQNPPMALALVHGAAAASGLVALIVAVRDAASPPLATTALVIFLVAAGGGFVLLFKHLRRVTIPVWLVVVHALVAVTAFATLLVAAMT
jgi:hypothetical protein